MPSRRKIWKSGRRGSSSGSSIPEKPFSPDVPKILLIGLLAGLGGGFGLAFFREQMDRSFYDAGDVEITLGLKVLATIPRIEDKAT
jgi:succinoglycan biosynthesis transport protein ExoP